MNTQEKIDEIMDNFNFENVYKAMVALEWGVVGKPDIPQLRKIARDLLKRVSDQDEKESAISTCGFTAEMEGDTLKLRFQVEECTVVPEHIKDDPLLIGEYFFLISREGSQNKNYPSEVDIWDCSFSTKITVHAAENAKHGGSSLKAAEKLVKILNRKLFKRSRKAGENFK